MLVDCNANLGNWPFRRLRYNDPAGLVQRLGRIGVQRAWVTLLDAVLLQDVHTANAPLAQMVHGCGALTPIATVNPTWPAWERDLAECAQELGFRAVRVLPNYHGWTLGATLSQELLAGADELGLLVQITVRICDERQHHPLMVVPPVDLAALPELAATHPRVPIVLANVGGEVAALARAGLPPNVHVELSHIEGVNGIRRLVDLLGVERVLFGTHAPCFNPEAAQLKVFRESELTAAEIAAISHGNAGRLLPLAQE